MTTTVVPEPDARELDEYRLQVVAEHIKDLRWKVWPPMLYVATIAWVGGQRAAAVGWFVCAIAVREWSSTYGRRTLIDRTRPIDERLRAAVLRSFLIGLSLGAAAQFIVTLDILSASMVTLVLASSMVAAISSSSPVRGAFLALATPIAVLNTLAWTQHGSWTGPGFGVVVVVGLVIMANFERRVRQTFEESFEIRKQNEALARQLAIERDAAEQANREKSRFLAAASHDLRQPLQAMTLNSGALLTVPLPAEARPLVGDIAFSIEQLRTMLDALLDLSKLDAGLVMAQPQRVRIALPVQAVMASFRAAATARGLDLRCDCPNDIEVVTDPELMRRMLANVVDNAIKFTDAGAVTVQVTAEDRDVQIAVRDTGPGIAPEHHGLIFEDTVQLRGDGGDRPPGHGLGLGIVRRTAALLKVDVIVDSAPGRGSVFHWRMPRAAASAVAVPPVHVETRLQGRQVLILDDDAMVRGAYANALSSAGAQMHTAATIAEAIGPAELADAVVVDWRLRDNETGFMAIERLRQRRPRLPMVMVTADTGAEIAEAAKQAGVAALLRKPVDAAELARALANAIVEAKPD